MEFTSKISVKGHY